MENNRLLTVARIEGEYAALRDEQGCELFIALSLLPPSTDVGSHLLLDGTDLKEIP